MSNKDVVQENKMGVMPVKKLLISMSLPMMLSMLVQALYNIVDSVFVAQISENALTAVSLAFPVQNLMISIAGGTGVGINALLSKSLGEKNQDEVNRAANNGVMLGFLSYLVFMVAGLLFSRFFFETQTSDPEIIRYGAEYLSVCTVGSVGLFGQMIFERLLQSTGKTMYSMVCQSVGAVINIIFDPIMIFGLFGFPAMGVAGAALATVLGQLVGMSIGLYFNVAKNREIRFAIRGFRPSGATIRRIYAVGLPSIIMTSVSSVMTFGMNKILLGFTSTATAVFGVYFKLQSFIFMPVFGLNNGMVPILSYNYGAKNRQRMVQTIRYSIMYAVIIMVAGFVLFQIFPAGLLSFFNASEEMVAIGVPALRIISYSFIFAGFCIVSGSVFQALGKAVLSLINSVARQLVILLPSAYLLSLLGTVDYVWFSFPIAELMSLTLTSFFLVHVYRRVIKPLAPGEERARVYGGAPDEASAP
ncbi:MAG: MATE family efflux transporter [Oscillospiraceae bacterium]|jgi:putative MATE family efflux protein|nr:MATE family efflux transporter [Oscillospiraceae bacterium]